VPRCSRWIAGLVVPLVMAMGCSGSGGDDDSSSPTTDRSTTTTTAATTSTVELTGQPLVVTEQGLSTFPDVVDPLDDLGGYGVIVQNPDPALMATGVRVITRVLDAAGKELLVDSALLNGILPGQRMAVGRTLIEPIEDPTTLDVKIEVTAWLPPASPDGTLVAENVLTEPEAAGGSVTRFTIRSSWPDREDGVDVTAVYRAEDGRILGAESTSVDVPIESPVDGRIRLLSPIPDLAHTEVFVGRGFAALTTG
jgi:hypothetical protein